MLGTVILNGLWVAAAIIVGVLLLCVVCSCILSARISREEDDSEESEAPKQPVRHLRLVR